MDEDEEEEEEGTYVRRTDGTATDRKSHLAGRTNADLLELPHYLHTQAIHNCCNHTHTHEKNTHRRNWGDGKVNGKQVKRKSSIRTVKFWVEESQKSSTEGVLIRGGNLHHDLFRLHLDVELKCVQCLRWGHFCPHHPVVDLHSVCIP